MEWQDALMRAPPSAHMIMPWEEGWLGVVYGNVPIFEAAHEMEWVGPVPPAPGGPFREVDDITDTEEIPRRSGVGTLEKLDRRKCTQLKPDAIEGETRRKAVEMWWRLAEEAGETSKLYTEVSRLKDPAMQATVVNDTFAEKSPATLKKRGGSLQLYVRWAKPYTEGVALPFTEELVYAYLCFLRQVGAPATRGQSFIEAVNLSVHLLGLKQDEEVMSARVRGVTYELWRRKRVTRPRDPLSRDMLVAIEKATRTHDDMRMRVFCGFVAALTHWRARVSDAQRALHGPFVDYCEEAEPPVFHFSLESVSDRIKTGQARKRARKAYHLVGHAVGASGLNRVDS